MIKKANLTKAVALIAAIGIIAGSNGIVATAEASSSGSHSLSLAGLSFEIILENLGDGVLAENCYTFVDDPAQTWLDPLFFGLSGTWVQHLGEMAGRLPSLFDRSGAGFVTQYTAFAKTPFPLDLGGGLEGPVRLIQNGAVSAGLGREELRLRAYSTVVIELARIMQKI